MPLHEQELSALLKSRTDAIRTAYWCSEQRVRMGGSAVGSVRRSVGRLLIALGQLVAGPAVR